MSSFTLFIPAKNELEGLKNLIPQVPKGLFKQILISNSDINDGTQEWAERMGLDFYQQKKSGLRHAYMEAWPLIQNPCVVTFSPDGNCRTEDLEVICDELSKGYDLVIGSRYLPEGGSDDDTKLTRIGNVIFTHLINFCFSSQYTDTLNILRGYKTDLFTTLDLHKEQSYSLEKLFFTVHGIEPLLSIRSAKYGAKTFEVPVFEPQRLYGKSKLQPFRWGSIQMWQILRELFCWNPPTKGHQKT